MAGVLYRLGRLCANRAIVVVAVWLGLTSDPGAASDQRRVARRCLRLVSVVADDLQHAGQAAFVRGIIQRS